MKTSKVYINKLLNYYSNISEPVKATFWFLICGFFQKGIGFITTPIFTRIMEAEQYGLYNQYSSWFSIFQIILSLNLAAGVYTRGLVKNEEDRQRFSSAMLGLSTTCIFIGATVLMLFNKQITLLTSLDCVFVFAMILEIWSNASFLFWSNRERVNYKYKKLVFITAVYFLLRPLTGIAFVLSYGKNQALARVIATVVVNLILFTGLFFSIMKEGKAFYVKKYWKYALAFNIPLVPHYLSQVVLNQSDKIMITRICGPTETAYYSVAYTLAMVMQVLSQSITSTMNPWIYKSIKANQEKRIGQVSYIVLSVVAFANFIVILIAPEILLILAPQKYQSALWVIPPVTISVYFMFLYNLFVTFEYYYEETKFVPVATGIGAVLNVILNAVLIPKLGFVVAGYTTLVCYMLYAVAHYIFMKKILYNKVGKMSIYNPKIIITIAVALLVSSFLVMSLYNNILVRYGLLLLMCAGLLINCKKILSTIYKEVRDEKV